MIMRMLGLEGLVTLMQLASAENGRQITTDADTANDNAEAQAAADGD